MLPLRYIKCLCMLSWWAEQANDLIYLASATAQKRFAWQWNNGDFSLSERWLSLLWSALHYGSCITVAPPCYFHVKLISRKQPGAVQHGKSRNMIFENKWVSFGRICLQYESCLGRNVCVTGIDIISSKTAMFIPWGLQLRIQFYDAYRVPLLVTEVEQGLWKKSLNTFATGAASGHQVS